MRRLLQFNSRVKLFMSLLAIAATGFAFSPRPPAVESDFPCELLASVINTTQNGGLRVALPASESVIPLVEGDDIIAGRQAWVLRLNPRQKPCPWLQLWVDKRTNEVLAFREWSGEDEMIRAVRKDDESSGSPVSSY